MQLLLGLSALFQLFLSSSTTFCSIQHPRTNWDKSASPEESETLEAPWLVNIFGNGKRCQGVILSSWWVLTAANCFLMMQPGNVELSGAHGRFASKTVSQFISHRGFSSWDTPPNNDLGLILLGQPVDLRKPDMWPACIIKKEKPYDTQEECRIIERGQHRSFRQSVKEIIVHSLVTSECAKYWPDINKSWNLCVSREMSNDTNCMMSVGSPVVCRDPVSGHWEVMGVVSQSLHNCTAPILASQILSHLKWLSQEGAVERPRGPHLKDIETTHGKLSSPAITPLNAMSETEGELSSTVGEPVTLPAAQTTTQVLQLPRTLPITEQAPEAPQAAGPVQPSETTLTTSPPLLPSTFTTGRSSPKATEPLNAIPTTLQQPTVPSASASSSIVTSPSPAANHVNFTTSSTIQKSLHITSTTRQSLPKTTAPHVTLATTRNSPLLSSSTTGQTSTTTREASSAVSSTLEQLSSATSTIAVKSTTTQKSSTTAGQLSTTTQQLSTTPSTTKQISTTSTIHATEMSAVIQPHVIIIPATTPKPSVPPPTAPASILDTYINQGAPVHIVVARPQFPKSKREEGPTLGPSLALLAPPSGTIMPSLQLPVRVTLKQCEMGLAWDANSHTYQLNKMAVLMDHRVGCGLRPDFVPKCPSCSEAELGEFPWVVSLKLPIQHFCAGSILNPWWILTSANCANLIKNSEALALVQAGLVDLSKATYSVQTRQSLTHPNWLAHRGLHSLGLLQLEEPLEFGPLVAPVCLSDKAEAIRDFRNCWLPGWSVLEGGPAMLRRHPLDILSITSCDQLGEQLSNAVFCIKAQMGQEGDCTGDVGSPLICPDPHGGAWLQLGVLSSFDEACSGPYVFSSLPHYLPWLERTTENLRQLQKPDPLVAWISAQLSMPWQVLIATCENQSCGGSILNHYWVLTTAQCVQQTDPASIAVFVRLTHPKGHARGIHVAAVYPYEETAQYRLSGSYHVALLLLQKPITFDQHVVPMPFFPKEPWDRCKVMGLQMLQSGEVGADSSAYQVKVLMPSDCAKEYPGVNPATYCVVRNSSSYLPAAAVGEGAALLCHLEAKSRTWSQVGLMSEPFPGSQMVVLSSSITSYVDWMEKMSRQAKHQLFLPRGRAAACGPSSWILLLILSLFREAELG